MVPLQAAAGQCGVHGSVVLFHTELLLDHLQNLLLVELLWEALNSRQSLTTIALYANVSPVPSV